MKKFSLTLSSVSLIIIVVCMPIFSDGTKSEPNAAAIKGIIEESKEHCQETIQLIEQMDEILRQAKKSNNPQSMRLALDGLEKPLTDIKEHLKLVINNLNLHKSMDQKKTIQEKSKNSK